MTTEKEFTSYGWKRGTERYVYGVHVNIDVPITGVVSNNTPMYLFEDMGEWIDPAWEEHCSECPKEEHDDCGPAEMGTYLAGDWKKDAEGKFEPDHDGKHGFSAIVGEIYTQVVWSKYTKRCHHCSPCYPGQGDLDTPGEFLTYDLPPDLYGDEETEDSES